MFSTNKNRKIGMLIFLFVVSFILGMLINIQRLGSLPMKLIQVEWNDTVGCVYENLDYENSSDHKYDLYVPKNLDTPESKCLILYIHGGSFNSGSKEDGDAWCKYYTSKGYVTATVEYTLQSKKEKSEEELLNASLELMNEEILSCVAAIKEQASQLGIDLTQMATCGVSAGGTLAMNYAYKNADISAIPVKFVFQLAGPASFEPSDWSLLKSIDHITTDADFATMMTGVRITDEMMASKEYLPYIYSVSPTYLVEANSVPTLMGYGLIDHCVPAKLKYPLIDALKENGVPYDYVEFPKSNHGMYNDIDKLQEFINLSLEYCDKYFDK